MDNYDVVIERTVRDLFKSSPLNQIKKFKQNKERDISKKDEELRNLILAKYPILIRSIYSLEQISSSLNDLQEIRRNFGSNIDQMEKKLQNAQVYQFNKNLFEEDVDMGRDHDEEDFNFDFEDNLKEEIDECWRNLNFEKNYEHLLLNLVKVNTKLDKFKHKINDVFIQENFEFLIAEFMENLMKDFVEEKIWISSDNTNSPFDKYFINFFGIFYLLKKREILNFSEFYLKLQLDSNINKFYNEIFKIFPNNNNSYANSTLELIFKLILLKLSKNLSTISNNSINNQEELMNALIDIFMTSHEVVHILNNLFHQNYKKLFKHIGMIFCLDEDSIREGGLIEGNDFTESDSKIKKNFVHFIKNEIDKSFNLKLIKINPSKTPNYENKTNEGVITFWIKTFNKIFSVFESNHKKSENFGFLDIPEEDEHLFYNFLFLDKTMEQLNEVFSGEFRRLEFDSFKNEKEEINSLLKIYSEVYTLNSNLEVYKNTSLIKTITRLLSQYTFSHLELSQMRIKENVKNTKVFNFINFLINLYSNKKIKFYLKELKFENILKIIQRISHLFFENELKEIEKQMNLFKSHLVFENYMEEKCYVIGGNNNSSTLIEIADYLGNKHNFEELEFDQEEYSKDKMKAKILELIVSGYVEEIKSILDRNEDIMNKRIINDLLVMNESVKAYSDQGIEFDEKVSGNLIELIERIKQMYNIDYDKEVESLNREKNSFSTFFLGSGVEAESGHLNNSNYSGKMISIITNKNNENTSPNIKEIIPHPTRLNVHMIPNKLPDKERTKPKNNLNNQQINPNSTSKLIEFRIDENYLSFKTNPQSNTKTDTPNSNQINSTNQNKSAYSENKSVNSSTASTNSIGTNIKQNIQTTQKSTFKATPTHSREVSQTSQTSQAAANIKGYLGMFGGILKDNLTNIKGYIDAKTTNPGENK